MVARLMKHAAGAGVCLALMLVVQSVPAAAQYQFPKVTVSQLPSAQKNIGLVVQVLDGASASDCSAGGAATNVLCGSQVNLSTGVASWVALGASTGGLPTFCSTPGSGVDILCTNQIKAGSFATTGTDPFVNLPTNPTHTCTAGDLYSNAGVPTFCPSTTPVALQPVPTITVKKGTGSTTNYTTTSTTFVVVDGTNLSYAATIPTGFKLTVTATANFLTPISGEALALFDGTSEIGGTESYFSAVADTTAYYAPTSAQTVITGDGASHTITMRYEAPLTGTATLLNSATNYPNMILRLEQAN